MLVRRIARPLLSAAFIGQGVETLRNPKPAAEAAKPSMDGLQKLPDPVGSNVPTDAMTFARINAGVQIGGGLLLATGKLPRLASAALAFTVIPGNLGSHMFWTEVDPERKAEARKGFLTDLSLIGGLIIASADTAGKPSLGWRGRRAARKLGDKVSSALPSGDSGGITDSVLVDKIGHGLALSAERGRELAHVASERGADLADAAKPRVAEFAEVAKDRGSELADVAKTRASELADAARPRVAELAEAARGRGSELAEIARDRGSDLADVARDRGADLAATATDTRKQATKAAKKRQKHLAKAAKSRASEMADTALDRGSDLAEVAKHRGSEFADVAKYRSSALADTAKLRGLELAEAARAEGRDLAKTADKKAKSWRW